MSLVWIAFIAGLIALEKTLAWGGRAVTYATALILLVLGGALLAHAGSIPGLTTPGQMDGMSAMPNDRAY